MRYCDLTDWCRDSISDSSQSISQDECFTDTGTNLLCTSFFKINCDGADKRFITPEECDKLCKNDKVFYQLVDDDEILSLQFHFKNEFNLGSLQSAVWSLIAGTTLIDLDAVNCCDFTEVENVSSFVYNNEFYTAKYAETISGGINYIDLQGIKLDVGQIPYNCFMLKITVYNPTGNDVYYSLPYKKIDCRIRDYITILGEFNDSDSLGNKYTFTDYHNDILGTFFAPSTLLKLIGEFKLVSVGAEQEINNNLILTSKPVKRYRMRLDTMNENAIINLNNYLNSSKLIINGVEVILDGTIEKGFDEGENWYPEIYFKEITEKIDNTCK
jgi:hypothetical protein